MRINIIRDFANVDFYEIVPEKITVGFGANFPHDVVKNETTGEYIIQDEATGEYEYHYKNFNPDKAIEVEPQFLDRYIAAMVEYGAVRDILCHLCAEQEDKEREAHRIEQSIQTNKELEENRRKAQEKKERRKKLFESFRTDINAIYDFCKAAEAVGYGSGQEAHALVQEFYRIEQQRLLGIEKKRQFDLLVDSFRRSSDPVGATQNYIAAQRQISIGAGQDAEILVDKFFKREQKRMNALVQIDDPLDKIC